MICSKDPIGYNGSKWNLYELLKSHALSLLDPSGEQWVDIGDPLDEEISRYSELDWVPDGLPPTFTRIGDKCWKNNVLKQTTRDRIVVMRYQRQEFIDPRLPLLRQQLADWLAAADRYTQYALTANTNAASWSQTASLLTAAELACRKNNYPDAVCDALAYSASAASVLSACYWVLNARYSQCVTGRIVVGVLAELRL